MTEQTDEYAGHGGSYLLDPKTGKRTRMTPAPEEIKPQDVKPAPAKKLKADGAATTQEG